MYHPPPWGGLAGPTVSHGHWGPLVTVAILLLAVQPCRWWKASRRWVQSSSSAQAQKIRRGDRESYCPRSGSKNRDLCFLLSILLLQNIHLFCAQPHSPKRYLIPVWLYWWKYFSYAATPGRAGNSAQIPLPSLWQLPSSIIHSPHSHQGLLHVAGQAPHATNKGWSVSMKATFLNGYPFRKQLPY